MSYYPKAIIETEKTPNKTGAFEITVNGLVVHSKKLSGSFVNDPVKFINDIKKIVEG